MMMMEMMVMVVMMVPIFESEDGLEETWITYNIAACIQHHRATVDHGHYTLVQNRTGGAATERRWKLDDEKNPCQLATISPRNAFVLVLVNPSAA